MNRKNMVDLPLCGALADRERQAGEASPGLQKGFSLERLRLWAVEYPVSGWTHGSLRQWGEVPARAGANSRQSRGCL